MLNQLGSLKIWIENKRLSSLLSNKKDQMKFLELSNIKIEIRKWMVWWGLLLLPSPHSTHPVSLFSFLPFSNKNGGLSGHVVA